MATTTALGQVGATCFSVVVGVAGAAGPAGRVIASVGAVVAVGAGTHALDMGQGLGSQGQGANGVREKVGEVEGSAMAEV